MVVGLLGMMNKDKINNSFKEILNLVHNLINYKILIILVKVHRVVKVVMIRIKALQAKRMINLVRRD